MKVLVVHDEKLQLMRSEESIKNVLEGCEVFAYTNPLKAFEENKNKQIDIAFLDIEMPGLNGIMLAKKLKIANPKINIIFVTAYDSYAREAMTMHASGYITKPVNETKVKTELDALRFPVELKTNKKLKIKCFGNFDIFYKGKPVKFGYSKSKEVFAYLVDREGSAINVNELNAVLWEEDHKSYLRNLIADIKKTLKAIDCEDVLITSHNGYSIDTSKVECDAYEYKNNNPDAVRMYRGEYMIQYSWAFFEADY